MSRALRIRLAAAILAATFPGVSPGQPNALARRAAPATDPYWVQNGTWGQKYRDQWALERIGWSPELARQARNPVIVAVIDTGLDYYHPDLPADRVFFNAKDPLDGRDNDGNGYVDDVIGWNFVDGNGNPWDHAGHGTHVAGVIAAGTGNGIGIAGMHPAVQILPLKVLNFIGQGRASRVAEAIYYAVDKGARVINLSLGGEAASGAAMRAVEYAAGKGVVVVVAAGNDGKEIARGGLAGLPNVITVGATGPDDVRAGFSNHGKAIDLVAPGVDILSLRARRTDVALVAGVLDYRPGAHFVGAKAHYYRVSGTSFAAPFVSGAAALILSRDPKLDAQSVKRMIVHSARDVGLPGVDPDTGYGLLDVKAAMDADPRFFVEAAIEAIAADRDDRGVFVRITGTADADRLARAWIEIGAGEDPAEWTKVSREIATAVRAGVLDDLKAELFRGAPVWTLRLVVEHADGKRREARHILRLG
jgi:subtilisin family serine protease